MLIVYRTLRLAWETSTVINPHVTHKEVKASQCDSWIKA